MLVPLAKFTAPADDDATCPRFTCRRDCLPRILRPHHIDSERSTFTFQASNSAALHRRRRNAYAIHSPFLRAPPSFHLCVWDWQIYHQQILRDAAKISRWNGHIVRTPLRRPGGARKSRNRRPKSRSQEWVKRDGAVTGSSRSPLRC